MSKNSIYWTLQFLGWTLLIMYEYIPYAIEYSFDPSTFTLSIVNILLCITLTHLYRLTIRRWQWSALPLPRLILRVALSIFTLGLIMTLINLPIDRHLLVENIRTQPFIFWMYFGNWCKNLAAWILSFTVYNYVQMNRMAELEKIMLKTSMREAEAKVLRSQLNPHFTFNALNSIRALVIENPEKAQQSITQLSNILRNSLLADRRKTVELREELKTVTDYLELEKVRYEERLKYEIETDPLTMYWQVPPMMLQTLVENGIKHGVCKARNGGSIRIVTSIDQGDLLIEIFNTGILGSKDSGGVGLDNTSERLSILYGKQASFEINQNSEDTVRATVRVPMVTEGPHQLNKK
jgi:two-component system LytT family sensor kinase